ncbi:hypothetical protein L9G74_16995 [Shewanella sp. C32]|uniref:Uncharacterized protein n=1 Tax=Shewanella electrica TaxID=515560 RepID=A0ABT2FQB9_9GAMM|nr:hypothetical protein [Shewanella electrica]MCH1925615.1 hypothetical protein [Shewanella electrica]MCS4558137.1 hypothetical protein [Shewanella electrica]
MRYYWLAAVLWFGVAITPTAHSEDEVTTGVDPATEPPVCSRVGLLWQQDGNIGMGPLYLGMPLQQAQAAGQLVPTKSIPPTLCGVGSAKLIMDDGAIEVIFDKQQTIISLKSRMVDESCSVAQQLTEAGQIFTDMQPMSLPFTPDSANGKAAYFRIGTPPQAWLMLTPEATQLDNGSCANPADTNKAPAGALE